MLGSRPFTSLELQNPSSTCKFTPTCSGTQRFTSAYNPFWLAHSCLPVPVSQPHCPSNHLHCSSSSDLPNRYYSKNVNPLVRNPPAQTQDTKFLGNLYANTELKKRGAVVDNGITYEIIVDVHDFQPHEVKVETFYRENSVVVRGEQNCDGNSQPEFMKKFCEKYYVPKSVDILTLNWRVSPGGQLIITGQHNTHSNSYGNLHNHYRHRMT